MIEPQNLDALALENLTDEQKALSEQRETLLQNPASAVQLIVEQNAHLFKNGRFNPQYLHENIKGFESFRERIPQLAEMVRKQHTGEPLSLDELSREIVKTGQSVTIHMENPEIYQNMPDTNLALLKALGAVPVDVTDLHKYINSLPVNTPEDNRYYADHGVPQRTTRLENTTHGDEIRHLPTKIDGVFVNGNRLYSRHPNTYGQWGFSVDFTYKAVSKMLSNQPTVQQPLK